MAGGSLVGGVGGPAYGAVGLPVVAGANRGGGRGLHGHVDVEIKSRQRVSCWWS